MSSAGGLQKYLRQLAYNQELERIVAMNKNAKRMNADIDKAGGDILELKSNVVLRKGTAYYKPSVPKAYL